MSKQPIPAALSEDDLPPPYTEQPNEHRFSSHLSNLQNSTSTTDEESEILALLVGSVNDFINQASTIRPPPKVIDGIFIPAKVLSPEWALADQGEKHKGELAKAIRVETQTKVDRKSSKETSSLDPTEEARESKEFDDWGRWDEAGSSAQSGEALWWTDEDLAERLARKIQPTALRGMRVTSENVSFRRENEMGIWESKSGWALVVRLEP